MYDTLKEISFFKTKIFKAYFITGYSSSKILLVSLVLKRICFMESSTTNPNQVVKQILNIFGANN